VLTLNKNKQKTLDKILYNNNLMWELIIRVNTTVATKCNAYERFIFEIKNKERWIGDMNSTKY
ncbi:5000_t:CDS:1, partial [Gigaspora margarita]